MAKQVPKTVFEGGYFYEGEILSDFQNRQRIVSKQKESIPNDLPNTIGMRTINPKSHVKKYLVECVSSSSLHGFNHLVAPNRHPVERFLAVLIIGGCLLCTILLSFLFWHRYQNNAITIAVSKNLDKFPIMKLSLFICPLHNVVPSKIPEVFRKYNIEHTPEAEEFFTFLSNASYGNIHDTPIYDEVPPDNWTDILYDLKKDISPHVLEANASETWLWTERGLCFGTRNLIMRHFSVNNWRKQNMPIHNATTKTTYYQPSDYITEKFFVEHTSMISALDPLEILIYDTPLKLVQSKRLQHAVVEIYRVGMLRSYRRLSISQRGCKVRLDGGLVSMPSYAESACYMECRMKVILKHCHCRPHFAKPLDGQRTCNARQLRCIGDIVNKLFLYNFAPSECGCLEKCNTHIYDIKITTNAELDDEPISSSVMTFTIRLPNVIYSRELTYDLPEFLSSIGGAAGLFLGASLLSFVELFYFATLRLYFRAKEFTAKKRKLNLFDQGRR